MPNSIDLSHPWLWLFFALAGGAYLNGMSDYTIFGRRRRAPGAKKPGKPGKTKADK